MPVVLRSLMAAATLAAKPAPGAADVDTAAAIEDLGRQLDAWGIEPDCIFAFYGEQHDDEALAIFLRGRLPGVPVIGGTSSQGLISAEGLVGGQPIGLLVISDPDGQYGVAAEPLGADPAAAAERALLAALVNADAAGELPALVWVYQAPGAEESVLVGLKRVVGDRCPIVGASSIDDAMLGHWRQLSAAGPLASSVVVCVLFPSGGVSVAYQGGYEPTGDSGIVTDVAGDEPSGKEIVSIDGESAAEVFDRWSGGLLGPDWRSAGQDIKDLTATDPLGVAVGTTDDVTYFRLIQCAAVTSDGHLLGYGSVRRGERIYAMHGSVDGLVRRARAVVASATTTLRGPGGGIAGGLVVYCAGSRLAVGERIDRVVDALVTGFAGAPFLTCFSGGEQGPILGRAVHCNLMTSAVVFGR